LLKVHVVAQPEHQAGMLCGDRVEDPVAAAVVLAWKGRIRVGDEEAQSDRDRQLGGVLGLRPVGLRAHHAFAAVGSGRDAIGGRTGGL